MNSDNRMGMNYVVLNLRLVHGLFRSGWNMRCTTSHLPLITQRISQLISWVHYAVEDLSKELELEDHDTIPILAAAEDLLILLGLLAVDFGGRRGGAR